jgi:hypothetical protein
VINRDKLESYLSEAHISAADSEFKKTRLSVA